MPPINNHLILLISVGFQSSGKTMTNFLPRPQSPGGRSCLHNMLEYGRALWQAVIFLTCYCLFLDNTKILASYLLVAI